MSITETVEYTRGSTVVGTKVTGFGSDLEASLAFLREWGAQEMISGNDWAMSVLDNNEYIVYTRPRQPCYGEMRTYGPKSTRPNDPRPTDLFAPFPKTGNPVAIVVRNHINKSLSPYLNTDLSPYTMLLPYVEVNDNYILLTNTHFEPTLIVKFFSDCRYPYESLLNKTRLEFVISRRPMMLNIRRMYHSNPNLFESGTFYDRFAYNRPFKDMIWSYLSPDEVRPPKDISPKELEEFVLAAKE